MKIEHFVTEQQVHVHEKPAGSDYWDSSVAKRRTAQLAPLVKPFTKTPGEDWRLVSVVPQPDDFVTLYWERVTE